MGVTGERKIVSTEISSKINQIRNCTKTPVAAGFGISTPEQVREVVRYADGVIVGSSIVKRIGERGSKPGFEKEIGRYVMQLTEPLKRE
jgi:tryptophan synthase alpha chain